MKRFHLVYKTINKLNENFYIGKHSTDVIDDGYLGSGFLLSAAVSLYGKENFYREILHTAASSDEASSIERMLVNEELLKDPKCYNLALGGQGGNLGEKVNKKIGEIMSEILSNVPKTEKHKQALKAVWVEKQHTLTDDLKERIRASVSTTWESMSAEERKIKCGHSGSLNGFFGKKHTSYSIQKMKNNLPDRSGSNNPRAKKVTINGVTYNTHKECLKSLDISKRKLYKLLGETQ